MKNLIDLRIYTDGADVIDFVSSVIDGDGGVSLDKTKLIIAEVCEKVAAKIRDNHSI